MSRTMFDSTTVASIPANATMVAGVKERLLSRLTWTTSNCWEWRGTCTRSGYGQIWVPTGKSPGRQEYVHRLVYRWLIGPIDPGLVIDHLCRNRRCANPFHLEAVTHRVNILRGTGASARAAKVTHCPHGHEYTPENTYQYGFGRLCRTCNLAGQRRYRERVK